MPSKHRGHPTIAFRPSTLWQYKLIEERYRLSGLHKKDFITKSCIYSNICVVGSKENVQRIVDATEELQFVMRDIVRQLQSGDFSLSEESYEDYRNELLALSITVVEILDGASYLFEQKPKGSFNQWKMKLEIDQFKEILRLDEDLK